MFEQSIVESGRRVRTKKPMTLMLSLGLQVFVLFILVVIPLIWYQVLPAASLASVALVPPPPPPPPPPPAPKVVVQKFVSEIQNNALVPPKVIPKKIAHIVEKAPPAPVTGIGVVGGVAGGIPGGVLGGAGFGPPPPPPPAAPPPSVIRVGGQVEAGNCRKVTPIYPPIARMAHISGTVMVHALVSKAGVMENVQAVSGNPMLVQAALQAARQWRCRPYILDGNPVAVDTTISFVFNYGE